MIRRGEIYLVDFGKRYHSELGKIRPAVVMQNDFINRAISEENTAFKGVVVMPLTTQLTGGDYRLRIEPRGRLEKESEIVAHWVCTVDLSRFDLAGGKLATLALAEMDRLVGMMMGVVGAT
ncbi:MAG: type II toxin-antitoxin system PemK/MazF family toxin [Campylobacterales bacterium]